MSAETTGAGVGEHKTFAYGQSSYDGDACRSCSWQGPPGSGGTHEAEMHPPAEPDAGDVEALTADDVDRGFAQRLADALIDAMCKADPKWDDARAKEVRSHMRTALASVGVAEAARERWECGPHANAWGGHDARCRKVGER